MTGRIILGVILLCILPLSAFPVTSFPSGNLLDNPWFFTTDGWCGSLDGWEYQANDGIWTTSCKGIDPAPIGETKGGSSRAVCLRNGDCSFGWAGTGEVSQVVLGQGAGNYLFGVAWVQFSAYTEWRIYGLDEIGGPEALLAIPHSTYYLGSGNVLLIQWRYNWYQLELPDYNFYRIVWRVDLLGSPLDESGNPKWDTGTKSTGVYFAPWAGSNPPLPFAQPDAFPGCVNNCEDPPPCEGRGCEPPPPTEPPPCEGRGCETPTPTCFDPCVLQCVCPVGRD